MNVEATNAAGLPPYSVRLLIKHPSADPEEISRALGMEADLSQKAGSQRFTPTGVALPGTYRETLWSLAEDDTKRAFFETVSGFLDDLEPHREYLRALVDGGGTVTLVVDLPGRLNRGSVLDWPDVLRCADMKIELGVEVFPNTR